MISLEQRALISRIPWWAKIVAKIILARVPISYSVWQRLGLFRSGAMDRYDYATGVFFAHVHQSYGKSLPRNLAFLELGPGDSLASAVIAAAVGSRAVLIDAANRTLKTVSFYKGLANHLRTSGYAPPTLDDCFSMEDILSRCRGQYMTNGLESLRSLSNESIDIIWSQAVLEHVRRSEFVPTIQEFRRVLKPNGVSSHRIDLSDHLSGGLNNLRFGDCLWESQFFRRSGFYTNRIRYSEMIAIFEACGFNVDVIKVDKFDALPLPKERMARQFRHLEDCDLRIFGFDVILRPIR